MSNLENMKTNELDSSHESHKKRLISDLPNTFLGFPVDQSDSEPQVRRSRGVALMMAIMIISIMMMFASDLIVSSTVDLTLATAERDNIKAEYIAKSGANWAIWLNLFDYGIDVQLSSSSDPIMKNAKSAIGPLWDKLNQIFSFDSPLDLMETKKFLAAFGMNALMDSEAVNLLQSLGGELGVGVVDEGSKVNLNVCFQSATACKVITAQLKALMSCTDVEKEYFKKRDLKPTEIAAKIQDWIDNNSTAEPDSGISDENDPYQKKKVPHKAKNGPLDTLEELRVVDGWTDELHAYFSPYLTVYPFVHSQDKEASGFKLNVNSANPDILKCIFSKELNSPDAKENFAKKFKELMETSGKLAGSDSEINTILKDMIGYQVDSSDKGVVEQDKSQWLTTTSRAYMIRAKGIVGDQTKVVSFALERQSILQRKSAPTAPVWRLNGYTLD